MTKEESRLKLNEKKKNNNNNAKIRDDLRSNFQISSEKCECYARMKRRSKVTEEGGGESPWRSPK